MYHLEQIVCNVIELLNIRRCAHVHGNVLDRIPRRVERKNHSDMAEYETGECYSDCSDLSSSNTHEISIISIASDHSWKMGSLVKSTLDE